MKGKIYLEQQLLKDTFTVKRYGKGLLVQIQEKMYKITTNKTFTDDENSPFKKINPIRSLLFSGGQCMAKIWQHSQNKKYWKCSLRTKWTSVYLEGMMTTD